MNQHNLWICRGLVFWISISSAPSGSGEPIDVSQPLSLDSILGLAEERNLGLLQAREQVKSPAALDRQLRRVSADLRDSIGYDRSHSTGSNEIPTPIGRFVTEETQDSEASGST